MPGKKHYYFTHKVKKKDSDGEEEREETLPLTVSALAEEFKTRSRDIRKILNSLSLSSDMPRVIKIGGKNWRVIWFDPAKLEKRLREFVVDYEPYTLYAKLGLASPATEATHATPQRHGEKLSDYTEAELEKRSPHAGSVASVACVAEPRTIPVTVKEEKSTSPERLLKVCKVCGKPIADALHDWVFEGEGDERRDYPAHIACAAEWRRLHGVR
jgi:hypothetical protein